MAVLCREDLEIEFHGQGAAMSIQLNVSVISGDVSAVGEAYGGIQ